MLPFYTVAEIFNLELIASLNYILTSSFFFSLSILNITFLLNISQLKSFNILLLRTQRTKYINYLYRLIFRAASTLYYLRVAIIGTATVNNAPNKLINDANEIVGQSSPAPMTVYFYCSKFSSIFVDIVR